MSRHVLLLLLFLPASAWSQVPGSDALPGAWHHDEAMRAYRAGQYSGAYSKFTASARWADKLSQFNLGVMYYQGQAVTADKVRALAWFQLAAERGYPQMQKMVEQVRSELQPSDQQQALAILQDELLPEYGDAVAVPRAARRMERARHSATGSRVGFLGAVEVIDRQGRHGGDQYFNRDNWNFYKRVEAEMELFDALDRARVTLGDLEIHEDEEADDQD